VRRCGNSAPRRHRACPCGRSRRASQRRSVRSDGQTAPGCRADALRLARGWPYRAFFNPAAAVRGPKHIVKTGKTPVLTGKEAAELLDSIDTDTLVGLRDRALISCMVYSFARVSAVVGMQVKDYFPKGKRYWFRLHEKGGKYHEVPCHHLAEEWMDRYLFVAQIKEETSTPLFRSTRGRSGTLTDRRMCRQDVFSMIRRRAKKAGLDAALCCHTFRATGITVFLERGGELETAATIAAHESTRTTQLYDRRGDDIKLEEVERIRLS
jgi:integrase/recombinase XerD